ncbi:MAG TPA: isochorismate synthase, partial [Ignavibacteriaceae bacterium]|nr:isochorismate synthase [Ignavibacteriaceae bacterium]
MKINLEEILEEFNSFTGSLRKINEPQLVNFAFDLQNTDALLLIDKLNEFSDDIFLFRTPNYKLTDYGFNSALELTSNETKTFFSLSDNYNHWKKNFVSNRSEKYSPDKFMLCCSAKFDNVNSAEEWIDFESLRVYVPEFLLAFRNDEVYGYYNFIINSGSNLDNIKSNLVSFLEKLSAITADLVHASSQKTAIQSTSESVELEKWKNIAAKAFKELNDGSIKKLVLSRAYKFNLNTTIIWSILLNELFNRFPDCYLFFIKKNNSVFFGSSPEMFLKVSDNVAEVESVAGSAPRGVKSESDFQFERSLKSSEKNQKEHLFVSDFISDILIKYSNNVRIIEEKQIRKLDNIQHLITRISAELNSKENLFELIDSLFPTPAVCGVQKDIAKDLIRKFESHDRGLYSGLIGLMDFDGNCELAVSIRSALVRENKVTAFAGAGLVKNFDADEEFLETNLKLNTI